ncbi:4Fe-4S dicluster domain-containing protein [Dyadobacter chenwenxiniae]|uniref:4Fe-4S dicluster domain-containing protein n=1 Tax=Dyadobacter chenwenxiniae TaxID=2906456 RepID=A0A9X1TEY0_9BACT|nr:4Fe-4S binding protein [Dyadobacter chenwenxiniae]MCF0061990.1 4Fe-4S dicluster domain-containing protein [Dyadobacter chenwenxiniae]UON81801.1 4Fe-4S dicluster domain-containing protein [Dyadobacter chenwenxiniae]
MSTYFKNISEGISTTVTGMRLTLRHLWNARRRRKMVDIRSDDFFGGQEGMVTIQYPQETIPIPDNGRYRLHNEIDDCIVCDKCVKVCPVDCIEIEPIRAIEEVGKASDGSPIRLYAAKFDIDMAKCCYCGLCTTVCPTECLTMTKTFDYSELDVRDMVYNYASLTPEEADEKRRLLEQFQKEKEALKAAPKPVVTAEQPAASPPKPVFRPGMKPKVQETETKEEAKEETPVAKPARPVFLPKKPVPVVAKEEVPEAKAEEIIEAKTEEVPKPGPRLPFKPSMKPKVVSEEKAEIPVKAEPPVSEEAAAAEPAKPAAAKPIFKPKMRPPVVAAEKTIDEPKEIVTEPEQPTPEIQQEVKPKPAFRPTMKPKALPEIENADIEQPKAEIIPEPEAKPKPAFRPTMKPKALPEIENADIEEPKAEITPEPEAKPKPAFRPTMKPKPKE